MISFRYHIVSIVAIFAGLAVGIVAGSTVVDRTLLENTRQNLETTNKKLDEVEAENGRLQAQARQLDRLAENGPDQFLTDRLPGVPVILVEAPGVRSQVRDGLRRSLTSAGASVVGEVVLGGDTVDPDKLASIATSIGSSATEPDAIQHDLGAEIGVRLQSTVAGLRTVPQSTPTSTSVAPGETGAPSDTGGGAPTTSTVAAPTSTSVFQANFGDLEDANIVDLREIATTLPAAGQPYTVVVVTDRRSDADATTVLLSMFDQMVGSEDRALLVASEAGDITGTDKEAPASLTDAIRKDGQLRDVVSTVDNAESFVGWAATVLAIDDLVGSGRVGHFGIHTGNDGLLPDATP